MKCPYPKCKRDYNDDAWPRVYDSFINPNDFGGSINDEVTLNRIYLITRKCRFCHQYFHEVYVGHKNFTNPRYQEVEPTLEFLVSYPCSKTKFEVKGVPNSIRDHFNEAERCRSVGSITGTGACLRKAIYALCDNKKSTGRDYKEKITNLSVKDEYKELLLQIKWLGDNTTKPGQEKYTKKMVDEALEILPLLVDELYTKDDRIEKVSKLLAKARTKNTKDK